MATTPFDNTTLRDEDTGEALPRAWPTEEIYGVLAIIFLIIGVCGNVLSLILMISKRFRSYSFSVYFRFLAVSDSLVLAALLAMIISDHFYEEEVNVQEINKGACFTMQWFHEFCRGTSSWFLLAITVDRFISIVVPSKRKTFCTLKMTIPVSIIIILMAAAFTIPVMLFQQEGYEHEQPCDPLEHRRHYLFWKDMFYIIIVPVGTIIILSSIMFGSLAKYNKDEPDSKVAKNLTQVSKALITIGFVSALTLLPVLIVEIIEIYVDTPEEQLRIDYAFVVADLIRLLNYAINFYILMLTGSVYRHALRDMFCGRRSGEADITHGDQTEESKTTL